MLRIAILLLFVLLNFFPAPAEEQTVIKETCKLRGQIEYDDNPVEIIYLDDNIKKPEVNIPKHSLTLPTGGFNITTSTNSPGSAPAKSMVNRNSIKDILP